MALDSSGAVQATYTGSLTVCCNITYGKIALDNKYIYVAGGNSLTRFELGNPTSGSVIYTENQIYDVKPLPNGNLFVATAYDVDEITTSGDFVRRIALTTNFFTDIRALEYDASTNILFVAHLGHTGFFDRLMRIDAATGELLNDVGFEATDLFFDLSNNLLAGARFDNPTFFSPDLVQGNSLNGGGQMFVTQYAPATLGNISTRLRVETGDNVLIGGFIVTGTQPKRIIVRAIGPSLSIDGTLADPVLELRDSSGGLIRSNDNWRSDQEIEIMATGIPPANDLESAIVATLPANGSAYTAIVRGANDGTGIGLVEAYDLDRTADSKLSNISTRGFVESGDNALIAGSIVLGQPAQRIIVRALGPSLSVEGKLANPTLELRNANGGLIRSNDNWRSDQEKEIIATGIPPVDDLESAIVETLPANGAAFTAIVRGVNTTGVAVVEVYGLD